MILFCWFELTLPIILQNYEPLTSNFLSPSSLLIQIKICSSVEHRTAGTQIAHFLDGSSSWVAETEEPGQEQYATASHHVDRDSDPGKELEGEVDNYQGENRIIVIKDMIKEEAKETQVR